LLKAEILLNHGEPQQAEEALAYEPSPETAELRIQLWMNQGWARFRLGDYGHAEELLHRAREAARPLSNPLLATEVELRWGPLLTKLGRAAEADVCLRDAARIAVAQGDAYLEAAATGNLGYLLLNTYRYDEAIFWFEKARAAFARLGAKDAVARAVGNLGWCYHRVGDNEIALRNFTEAEAHFRAIGNRNEQQIWLGNVGNVLFEQEDFSGAAAKYRDALDISRDVGAQDSTGWWLYNLANANIYLRDFKAAQSYNSEALRLKESLADHTDYYPRVNEARIAAGIGDMARAEKLYRALLANPSDDPTPVLDAESGMAELLVQTNHPAEAEARFRSAIASIESRRAGLTREEFKLSYLESLIRFYQAYVDFLITRGETVRALEVAESSRARLLDERLGSAAGRRGVTAAALKALARVSGSVVLTYWLAPGRSFLWVVTPDAVKLHELPPEREIAALVNRYRGLIEKLRDPLDAEDPAGRKLTALLLGPAWEELARGAPVIVVPDRSLYSLNLETLPDLDDASHYLIEKVTLTIAPSLGLLEGGKSPPRPAPSILVMGDAAPAAEEYPRLPYAGREIAAIADHFPEGRKLVVQGESASPEAYRAAGPEKFPWIHFAAHASANRENPLESALILSRGNAGYALTAREAMTIPLRADLVTLSACRGAGARTYSGEGLVGLSWAFLRAGARSVVAGLWDVTDLSTSQLMGDFYGRLLAGAPPREALRQAKLALVRSKTAYRKPFYWGPFELYAGAP
jgi:CHAT domain-containing protein/tetratricopeptide (TPR) repeat protein